LNSVNLRYSAIAGSPHSSAHDANITAVTPGTRKPDSSCRTGNRNRRADARQQQIPRLLSRDDLRRFPGGSLSRQWSAGTVAAHNLALVWLPSRRTETAFVELASQSMQAIKIC